MKNILIFGATGSIGNHIYEKFKNTEFCKNIYGTSSKDDKYINVTKDNLDELDNLEKLDIIVWAQGYNFSDNIYNFNEENFMKMFDINVTFILKTLNYLLLKEKINYGCKIVIISSIWETNVKDNKLSYVLSKTCLNGLVKSLAYDLSNKNILINNVLPGVVYNEMSKQNLSLEQLDRIKKFMNFDRMIDLDDVYNTIKFLTIDNTGITGESITVDLGFTKIKKI